MPLKIHIALSRKIGVPNYGSRGATVGLEIDVGSDLAHQPRQLQQRISQLFALATQAVDRQLSESPLRSYHTVNRELSIRAATPAQIRALYAIVNGSELDLAAEVRQRFHVDRPEDLTVEQASQLIGALRQACNGAACPSLSRCGPASSENGTPPSR